MNDTMVAERQENRQGAGRSEGRRSRASRSRAAVNSRR